VSTFSTRDATSGVRPVECVTFARGAGAHARVWHYTTADVDVTVNGVTYRASTFTRGPIRRTTETGKTRLELRCAAATPCVADWRDDPWAPVPTSVSVLRVHVTAAGVPVSPLATAHVFSGTVEGVVLANGAAEVACAGLATALERELPQVVIAKTCPWALYGPRCGLDPADFQSTAVIAAVGTVGGSAFGGPGLLYGAQPEVTLTMDDPSAPTLNDTYTDPDTGEVLPASTDARRFDGGTFLWTDPATGRDRRTAILTADLAAWPAVTLVLYEAVPAGAVGDAATVWAGCEKTLAVCKGRFANDARFGGFPFLPERSPLVDGLH
jgi:hypothetical protein